MRKYLLMAGWLLVALGASPVLAGTPAMVLNAAGDVVVDAVGKAGKVEPFSRLLEGDRVKLAGGSRLTLVYAGSGRQEIWSGPGVIAAGQEQSAIVSGQPDLQARQLPRQVALQMARTPQLDSTGKTGMVRMRAIGTPEALASLEQKYQDMRSQAAPEDRNPEIYFLAGLFEQGAHERLGQELSRLREAYPGDESIQVLAKLYARAIGNARQAAKR